MMLKKKKLTNVFVVGCGHSGTSLIIRILGSHTKVYAIEGESGIFLHNKSFDEIDDALKKFESAAKDVDRQYVIEKTPRHVYHMGDIFKHRRRAKIIALARDPRDVACSIRARGYSFTEGLERWIADNSALLEFIDNKNVLLVKLEDFVEDPSRLSKDLQEFIGLPLEDLNNYHSSPVEWYTKEAVDARPPSAAGENHTKLRNWQINQPVFKTTVRYNKDMDADDIKVFNDMLNVLKPVAERLGYNLQPMK